MANLYNFALKKFYSNLIFINDIATALRSLNRIYQSDKRENPRTVMREDLKFKNSKDRFFCV